MAELIGKITASLIETDQSEITQLIEKLNNNINPPERINPEDVHIRAMYIVSDRVNSYGGRFPADEHDRLIELLVDSPVLVGHRKDSLPIARNFHAERAVRGGINWVKAYFYWLKDTENGDDLQKNIDGGIYKECSISFIFSFPECSICKSDIRECDHRLFEEYDTPDGIQSAFFNYRQIEKVLETSLVYRGSVKDTSITRELVFTKEQCESEQKEEPACLPNSRIRIWDLDVLDKSHDYYVLPAYESITVLVDHADGNLKTRSVTGSDIRHENISGIVEGINWPSGKYSVECRLIGYRGKQRQRASALVKFLNGDKSIVRRVELKVTDLISIGNENLSISSGNIRREKIESLFKDAASLIIPAERCEGCRIAEVINRRGTRFGAEILDCNDNSRYLLTHRKLIPAQVDSVDENGGFFKCILPGYQNPRQFSLSQVAPGAVLHSGDWIELEISSMQKSEEELTLVNPRFYDSYCRYEINEKLYTNHTLPPDSTVHNRYCLYKNNSGDLLISLGDDKQYNYRVINFSANHIAACRRFLVMQGTIDKSEYVMYATGRVLSSAMQDNITEFSLDGVMAGRYRVKPAILKGVERILMYRIPDDTNWRKSA